MATVHVLSLEDDDLDAELVQERLLAGGLDVQFQQARSAEEYLRALDRPVWDIILADFSLPGYDGMAALEAARQKLPDVPFIFVSGAIGEERAIETLRRGATDYVLKNRLERLNGSVRHALDLAEERRRRREAEAERDRLLISEREAREQSDAANRMKDEFLAVVSHELRTPLNAILGWASLLATSHCGADRSEAARSAEGQHGAESQRSAETLRKGLETIQRNAQIQSRLIEDLLDISRIVTGKLQLRVGTIAVANFVATAVEAVRPAAEAKNVLLRQHVTGAGDVDGDSDRLQQVVWNLVSNAVKFSSPGAEIDVTAERRAESVVIGVRDTGQGIEPSFLPHVFERFRQADASITRRQSGLGLGLAIVRNLVELHGGTVSAESEGRGRGAYFEIRLPIHRRRGVAPGLVLPAPKEPQAVTTATGYLDGHVAEGAASRSLLGLHALVVEDDPDTRDLIAFVLRSSGARVSAASSVAQALELLTLERPHVIISDIGMPGADGYSFMRRVRALPARDGGRVPAIALTAYSRELDRREAESVGFQRHVAKPVTPSALLAAVLDVATLSV